LNIALCTIPLLLTDRTIFKWRSNGAVVSEVRSNGAVTSATTAPLLFDSQVARQSGPGESGASIDADESELE
jgi:hypothetical protein